MILRAVVLLVVLVHAASGAGVVTLDVVSPQEVAAEKDVKKANDKAKDESQSTNLWHKRENNGNAEYARDGDAGTAATSEIEWKNHLANKSLASQGVYAKGEYAMNDTDWEKKLGGYPSDMIAAEKKQKLDLVILAKAALEPSQPSILLASRMHLKRCVLTCLV